MIYRTADKVRTNDTVIDTVQSDIDYVDSSGDIHVHVKVGEIIVTDEDDLATLTGYNVGSIAYLAGFSQMWQLNAAGDWVEIGATSDDGGADDSGADGEGGE